MNAEQRLLLNLLRNEAGPKTGLPADAAIDWQYIITTAHEHMVIPLLYRGLNQNSIKIPAESRDLIDGKMQKFSLRNLNYKANLIDLTRVLEDCGVPFLSYKGLTLGQLAYGDPSLRQFGDIDIFIKKEDFPAVRKALFENGGRFALDLSEKEERAFVKYSYEIQFVYGKQPVLVEMHWAFIETFFGFDFENEDVFSRSQMVSIEGQPFLTLSNEDMLLILCVHGSKHYWKRLSWISDVANLIQSQSIDWTNFIKLAKKFGCIRMVAIALVIAAELMNSKVPSEFEQIIAQDIAIKPLADDMIDGLFNTDVSAEAYRPKIHLKMRERWRDKFTYTHRLFRTKVTDSLFLPMGRPQ